MNEGCKNKKKIFGIIGYPVKHSLSPVMHNAAFKRSGINAVYLSFEVAPENLGGAIEGAGGLGICGLNVTIPHKEAVIKYLDIISPEAKLIGAVNTIVNKGGKLSGYNTDVYGFMKSLEEDLRFTPKGRNAFIVGSGGAAKAVAFGLAMAGAKRIVLTDVAEEKALELACDIELKTGCDSVALRVNSTGVKEMILNSDLLVNATPCGMKAGDPITVNTNFFHKGLFVFDLVYNRETGLVRFSKSIGLGAAGGLNMLLYQGAKSFELWTGKKAPIAVMRAALRKAQKL